MRITEHHCALKRASHHPACIADASAGSRA
ncbi:hypothetical protein PD5205_03646 [Xanthomonas fragariae]|uniref:Uncharacterized protein n=1 Tax=Xanthomonas fragariae TaxID=48664 RepID=A0A1Y6HRN2_9XANT|nr:hypothetical protein PD885_00347 [Xanthomonas fragariae]SMR04920.1 hypothetical protein PD5205_03646 [Xanthomonas fragariae]